MADEKPILHVRAYEHKTGGPWSWRIDEELDEVDIDGVVYRDTSKEAMDHARKWFKKWMPNCEIKFVE